MKSHRNYDSVHHSLSTSCHFIICPSSPQASRLVYVFSKILYDLIYSVPIFWFHSWFFILRFFNDAYMSSSFLLLSS